MKDILAHAKPRGHNEQPTNLNLGFGFLYYGLVRALRPKHVLVIGSGFGFSVVCLALGLKDNGKGRLSFVDPSFSVFRDGPFKTLGGTGQWSEPSKVHGHFMRFGLERWVTHYRMTSQRFFECYAQSGLPAIDMAFIDGSHAYEDVKNDFLGVLQWSRKNTYILLHDTNIYIRAMVRHAGVRRWLRIVKRDKEAFEAVDFPFFLAPGPGARAAGQAMEAHFLIGGGLLGAAGAGYLYWRHVWFFRNPPRVAPLGEGVLSPADGTVV